ncbi:MAG: hypothetical protein HZA93_29280 [Verrucomicrobia bacterium]|nr:hypothetical protein [Verrucomicrobiota bacterium]
MPTTTESPTTAGLLDLDSAAKSYRTAADSVAARVDELDHELRELYRRKLPGIRKALGEAKSAQDAAVAAVLRNKPMFEEKRTLVLRGVKLGLQKGAGKLDWEIEDDELVARIAKLFKGEEEMLAQLLHTAVTPAKDGLKQLDAAVLAKLGVTVEGVGDYVVVSDTDSDARKLVKRILKEGAVHEIGAKS